MKLTASLAAALMAGLCFASAGWAQVTGKVMLEGEAPPPQEITMGADAKCAAAHPNGILDEAIVIGNGNELANVVISIQAPEGKELKGEAPTQPAVLDQQGCQYKPHVLAMMVGQELVVKNSDSTLHNVHSLAFDNEPFNFGQASKGATNKVGNKITMAERFQIKCDIHPWMNAYVNAFEHPFFAVSKEDGTFDLPTKGLEDGTYTVEIWHERLAPEPITQEIEVKDGKADMGEIKVPVDAAARADDAGAPVKLASADGNVLKPACCADKSKAQAVASAEAGKSGQ